MLWMESYFEVALSVSKWSNALTRCEDRSQVLFVLVVDSGCSGPSPVIRQRPSQVWGTGVLTGK